MVYSTDVGSFPIFFSEVYISACFHDNDFFSHCGTGSSLKHLSQGLSGHVVLLQWFSSLRTLFLFLFLKNSLTGYSFLLDITLCHSLEIIVLSLLGLWCL